MRCNFKLLHVLPIAMLVVSSPSFANMSEWTRNNSPASESPSTQSTPTPVVQNDRKIEDTVINPTTNNIQRQNQNIISPSKPVIPKNKYSISENSLTNQTANPVIFTGVKNGESLSIYMSQAQGITRSANTEANRLQLSAKSKGALNVYTANLMSVGVDAISGDDPSDSLRNYNLSVGCINNLKDPNLLATAKNALASTIRAVDIRRIVSDAYVLGSSMTSQCSGI